MGIITSRFRRKRYRIIMLGLDASGKTTLLYCSKLNDVVNTIPTIGFNYEKIKFKRCKFEVWDIGGQDKIRELWYHYFNYCDGVIYVIDSADTERLKDSLLNLQNLIEQDELRNCPFLVVANKQDLEAADTVKHIRRKIYDTICNNPKRIRIQGASAIRNIGIVEGLKWLYKSIEKISK